jgi:hypothetical protein
MWRDPKAIHLPDGLLWPWMNVDRPDGEVGVDALVPETLQKVCHHVTSRQVEVLRDSDTGTGDKDVIVWPERSYPSGNAFNVRERRLALERW